MPFIVEDGTGMDDSTSYTSEDIADIYFEDRANDAWANATGDKEGALVRGTQALDGIYRSVYPGTRTHGRAQALEWPRQNAFDAEGLEIGDDEIPIEIIEATCELALREVVTPGSVLADLERGGAIKRIKAGSVEIEYANNATATAVMQTVDGIMSSLIGGSAQGVGGGISGFTTRG